MLTKKDLEQIGDVIEAKLEPVKKGVFEVKKRVRKIEKTTDVVAKMFNEDDMKLSRRITRIEDHLGLP